LDSKEKMKPPHRIELQPHQVDALRQRLAARALEEADYLLIEGMIETIVFLSQALEEKDISIKKLLGMIFGLKTEKAKNVLGKSPEEDKTSQDPADICPDGKDGDEKKVRKGHGRNGVDTYSGAEKVCISHTSIKSGDSCPLCVKGKVYRIKTPKVVVRVVGRAPLTAKVWELESLRCNLCGEVFTAQAPQEVGEEKYDATCGAMIALLKYGSGFPFYRLEGLQKSLGIPLPASTQWDIVEGCADKIYPAYEELIRQAAQGQVLHNDDTVMNVLALMKSTQDQECKRDDPSRKGLFTTGILSVKEEIRVALFFTGRKHAGENLADVLKKRQSGLSPPIQMCDALSRNLPQNLKTLLANCLSHARRKFIEVIFCFPEECRHLVEVLAKVYHYDDIAKEQNLSDDERLKFHQEKSGPLMEQLKVWLYDQIEGRKVEPNSSIGNAMGYMLKHWDELTLFLRVPKAPLDNNLCEQILKRAILHRKNALFYKTEFGAYLGDLFMSIVHTCYLNKVNPFDYLVALQKYSEHLFKNPQAWMPWNYKSTISLSMSPQPLG
jgi:transposase